MANENKFRRLQCEQACEKKIGEKLSPLFIFSINPITYLNDYGAELFSILGGNGNELTIKKGDTPITMQQLKDAFDNEEFNALMISYDNGQEEGNLYTYIGLVGGITVSPGYISISIDSSLIRNIGGEAIMPIMGVLTGVNYREGECGIDGNQTIADADQNVVGLYDDTFGTNPIYCRAGFYKL